MKKLIKVLRCKNELKLNKFKFFFCDLISVNVYFISSNILFISF